MVGALHLCIAETATSSARIYKPSFLESIGNLAHFIGILRRGEIDFCNAGPYSEAQSTAVFTDSRMTKILAPNGAIMVAGNGALLAGTARSGIKSG